MHFRDGADWWFSNNIITSFLIYFGVCQIIIREFDRGDFADQDNEIDTLTKQFRNS
jgi:hypothetical protein